MIKISRGLLAFMLLLLLLSTTFPRSTSHKGQQAKKTETMNVPRNIAPSGQTGDQPITITSGKIQITTPSGWKTAEELNDQADLQAVDVKNRMYLIVLTDNKIDYSEMTLDKHSKETLAILTKPLTSMTKSGPTNLRVNGNPALQYEVRGTFDSMNVVYLHTTVETSAHFQQIVTWTLVSTYARKKDVIQEIIRSFKEIGR